MTVRLAVAVLAGAALVGCTSPAPGPDDASPTATSTPQVTRSAPTLSPTPESSPTETPEEVVFGTGTVTVDGTELAVSGDCDISRDFGDEPVTDLDDEVDVLLAVDNLTGDGSHDGPFALQVRLLGRGELVGREVTSEGAPGADGATLDATYEGEIEVAELVDRRRLEFVDVATLHLETSQQVVEGPSGAPARRDLVVDVTCPITRP